ncbi:MAG: glucosamine-6-phosphate deaminase [Planctomycetia bacterium]|nr:glucosamine-6-phosphate deaminase [Planctomycetia bacterium]
MATICTERARAARKVAGTRLDVFVFDSHRELNRRAAQAVADTIRQRNSFGQNAVLGLPTGSTPMGVYRELVRMHKEEGLDFSGVVTFNLDEYLGVAHDQLQSYHYFMTEVFFRHVNMPQKNSHIPDGTIPPDEADDYCRWYESQIERAGGIDLMLLGIGRDGHIGFNEPFSPKNGRTQLVTLDPVTRRDAAADFFGDENVPTHAVTMGIGTIMEARKVILLAMGEHKAGIVREAAENPISDRVPGSYLQDHEDAAFLIDSAAAAQLTAVATPWELGKVEWDADLTKRAVLWLSQKTKKALLKLTDVDFREYGLHQLLREKGPAATLCHRVFQWMQKTIEYHPGGKGRKRILVFSPHPDDDVISMGGTLVRLVEDKNEVHVAYMTSGNIAVFDHDAQRMADLVAEYNRRFEIDDAKSLKVEDRVMKALAKKRLGECDDDFVLEIKGLIRQSEAKAGAKVCGVCEEQLHFLNLPFYCTGKVLKNPPGLKDVKITRDVIEQLAPKQIYLAGDLSDPHGTHRVCADVIFTALAEIERAGGTVPEVLMYRGAWEEWPPHQIEIAVPLSPCDLERKKNAIFRHESQKDTAPFPGSDSREFWQRAVERNKHTAELYNNLGLPEYFAMEAFVRWDGVPI